MASISSMSQIEIKLSADCTAFDLKRMKRNASIDETCDRMEQTLSRSRIRTRFSSQSSRALVEPLRKPSPKFQLMFSCSTVDLPNAWKETCCSVTCKKQNRRRIRQSTHARTYFWFSVVAMLCVLHIRVTASADKNETTGVEMDDSSANEQTDVSNNPDNLTSTSDSTGASASPKPGIDRSVRSYSFYDDLRKSPTASFRPMEEPVPSVGRTLHIVQDPVLLGGGRQRSFDNSTGNVLSEGSDPQDTVTMCHVPIFLRYSEQNLNTHEFMDVSHLSYGGTAGALLAMHHFNNGIGTIVEELDGINKRCNIRFTTEVVDTQSSPIVAVQNLANKITSRRPDDIEYPQACAVMGAAWYTVSQSMATVTGVYDLLQVSPSSSSMSLDSMAQFPLFSRTHPSDEAKGRLAVEYFTNVLESKNFGIFFVNNELGLSLQKTVLDAAAERNVTSRSVSFPENPTEASLRNSLRQLKETGFNYFLGIFFPLTYDFVMGLAYEEGVAGDGKFWLTTGHLADSFAGGNTTIPTMSSAAKGATGMAILHDDGGPGLKHYDTFLREWKKLRTDSEALNYINSKQPKGPEGSNTTFIRDGDYFDMRPSHYSQFSYDAIAGMGLSACAVSKKSILPDGYFSGKEHHTALLENKFMGATGEVRFPKESFSRDGYSVYYFVSEIHEISRARTVDNEISIFSGTTKLYFNVDDRQWKKAAGAGDYIYSDGTTEPPPELPPHTENMNLLALPVQVICLFLSVAVILTSIVLSMFVFTHRKNQVITASQPPFLYIICTGTVVLSSSIIPLSVDDSVASPKGCSVACMARIWLMSIGFTITFSALFSKTWRINKLVRKARGFKRVQLSAADVTIPFLILFGANVLILTVWTIMANLEWIRVPLAYDAFNRPIESLGMCMNPKWLPYGITLFMVNGIALLLAIAEAYKARNINTEFSESKYIGMAVVCIFQALFFGVPLFFIAQDWPTAQVFVVAAVIFIICMAVLLLIFVPKIILIKNKAGARNSRNGSQTNNGRASSRHRPSAFHTRSVPSNAHWGLNITNSGAPRAERGSSLTQQAGNGSSTMGSYNLGNSQSLAALQANALSLLNLHQMPSATPANVEGMNVNVYAPNGTSQPSSGTESTVGLEEEIWNSTHLDGLNRLQNELSKACMQIQTIQQEIDALNWSSNRTPGMSTRSLQTTLNNDHSASGLITVGLGGDAAPIEHPSQRTKSSPPAIVAPSAAAAAASECAREQSSPLRRFSRFSHRHATTGNANGGNNRSSVSFRDENVPADALAAAKDVRRWAISNEISITEFNDDVDVSRFPVVEALDSENISSEPHCTISIPSINSDDESAETDSVQYA